MDSSPGVVPGISRAAELRFGVTLTAAMAAGGLMPNVLGAAGPFLSHDLGIDELSLGVLTTAFYAAATAGSVVAGSITEWMGAQRGMLLLFAVAVTAFVLMGTVAGYAVLVIVALLAGFTMAFGNPVTNDLVAFHVAAARQGFMIGVKQAGVQVAALVAGLLVPLVAHLVSWRAAAITCAVLLALGLAATEAFVPRDRVVVRKPSTVATSRHPQLGGLVAFGLFSGAAYAAVAAYLPLYAVEQLSMSAVAAGQLLAALGLVGIASRMLWVRAVPREHPAAVPRALVLIAASAVVATLLVALARVIGAWVLWPAVTLYGSTIAAWTVVAMLAVVQRDAAWSTAKTSGQIMAGYYGGLVVGPVIFGSLVVNNNYTRSWVVSTLLFGVALLIAAGWWNKARPLSRPDERKVRNG